MSHGYTLTEAEIKCLLEIRAEDYINEQMERTHKIRDTFKRFSSKNENGYQRSAEQCCIKVKSFDKVSKAPWKTGSINYKKDKFPYWEHVCRCPYCCCIIISWVLHHKRSNNISMQWVWRNVWNRWMSSTHVKQFGARLLTQCETNRSI